MWSNNDYAVEPINKYYYIKVIALLMVVAITGCVDLLYYECLYEYAARCNNKDRQ